MSKVIKRWVLYDSLTKTQSNPVSTEDAQMAIFRMSEIATERFFIWTHGWEKWQPLKAYLESKQKYFISSLQQVSEETVKAEIKDVLKMKPADKEVEEEITKSNFSYSISKSFSKISLEEKDIVPADITDNSAEKFDFDDLTFSKIKKPEIDFSKINNKNVLKNRFDRHELKIEILLISTKGKTFRSRSLNISMSGSLLEDNIPFDYSDRVFDIVVINKQPCDPQFQRVSLKAKTVGSGLTQRIHYVGMTATTKQALQNLLENYIKTQEKIKKAS